MKLAISSDRSWHDPAGADALAGFAKAAAACIAEKDKFTSFGRGEKTMTKEGGRCSKFTSTRGMKHAEKIVSKGEADGAVSARSLQQTASLAYAFLLLFLLLLFLACPSCSSSSFFSFFHEGISFISGVGAFIFPPSLSSQVAPFL